MTLSIQLLGRPAIRHGPTDGYRFRSRKSWALLTYLLLTERAPTRSRLATLLFETADDPLRALRWNLSEIRRGLGDAASLEGDPVVLELPSGATVDVDVIVRGAPSDAVRLPGLGLELLEGMTFREAAAFELWLLSMRRHLTAASEAVLHEAALSSLSRGALTEAIDLAAQAVALNPLDEEYQALLIRAYRAAGDDQAAVRQLDACTALFAAELGVAPGPAVRAAMAAPVPGRRGVDAAVSVEAVIEAGSAAVAAGAVAAGVESLRAGVALADRGGSARLSASARLALAEALIHSLRGDDEEGSAILHTVVQIAGESGDGDLVAEAEVELGYVDFLRARYRRSQLWLVRALDRVGTSDPLSAKALTYSGSVASDLGHYEQARSLLGQAITAAAAAADARSEAYARAMLGRVHLLRDELAVAAEHLDAAITLCERDRWLAFLPWPQALRGEIDVRRGELGPAADTLEHAFARACQLADPCWEGVAARGLALAAEAGGDTGHAFDVLADARVRCNRLSDTYVWLDVYILDAQCELGLRHDHSDTRRWVEVMHRLATRTGMREMIVRSLLHRAAAGDGGDAAAARLIAAEIDNPVLHRRVAI